MRTEQIHYLNIIQRFSSLHKASNELHISTQALSLSIRTLENELGFTILDRSRTGVTLTKEGQYLLEIGLQFLDQIKQIQNNHRKKYDTILTGSLRIMATNGVIETLFPPLISQLLTDYPRFRLKSIAYEFDEILNALNSGDMAELGFVYRLEINDQTVTPYDSSQFVFTPLLSGSYYCTVPEKHPISHYKTISLNTMAKYPIILFTPTSSILLKLFSSIQLPEIIFADSFTIYKQLLKDGVGLGMTFVLNESDTPMVALPNLKFIPFKERINSDLGFLYNKTSELSPKSSAFIEYLTEYLLNASPKMLSIN